MAWTDRKSKVEVIKEMEDGWFSPMKALRHRRSAATTDTAMEVEQEETVG